MDLFDFSDCFFREGTHTQDITEVWLWEHLRLER